MSRRTDSVAFLAKWAADIRDRSGKGSADAEALQCAADEIVALRAVLRQARPVVGSEIVTIVECACILRQDGTPDETTMDAGTAVAVQHLRGILAAIDCALPDLGDAP